MIYETFYDQLIHRSPHPFLAEVAKNLALRDNRSGNKKGENDVSSPFFQGFFSVKSRRVFGSRILWRHTGNGSICHERLLWKARNRISPILD